MCPVVERHGVVIGRGGKRMYVEGREGGDGATAVGAVFGGCVVLLKGREEGSAVLVVCR